ncbi:hypothetical protein EIP91_003355 [Steccherinum ochraceum]|uniref:F-box domain-containing protein n=1 Tax=Steccherinum ochraceum TaxID=92696 RepID=A0A4R0RJ45_9APHY|nr:hypothetical protein EIP91_003355 [Steccherinum ochraceum]
MDCEDRKALLAMVASSKVWRRAALPILYRVVRLSTTSAMTRLHHIFDVDPGLVKFVHEVQFKIPPGGDAQHQALCMGLTHCLSAHSLRPQILHLHNLTDIDREALGKSLVFGEGEAMVPVVADVRQLKMTSCTFRFFTGFQNVLNAFPRLEDLTLDAVSFETAKPTFSNRRPVRLRRLTVGRHCDIKTILSWCLRITGDEVRLLTSIALQSLGTGDLDNGGLSSLGFLRQQTRDLTLGLNLIDVPKPFLHALQGPLNLSTFSSINVLRLRLLDLQPHSLRWVTPLLYTLVQSGSNSCSCCVWGMPSRSITTLIFDVWLFNAYQLQIDEWDNIIMALSALSTKKLPFYPGEAMKASLRKIVFVQRGPLDIFRARETIKRRLGFLDSANTVNVEVIPPEA